MSKRYCLRVNCFMKKAPLKLAREWISNADEDFEFAKVGLAETKFYAKVCFHCQQAAEKYLKGYLIFCEIRPEPIHDLVKLLKQASRVNRDFNQFSEIVILLGRYAVITRYPEEWPPLISKDEAKQAIEFAGKLGDFVKAKLK